jgi:hypothetical protein
MITSSDSIFALVDENFILVFKVKDSNPFAIKNSNLFPFPWEISFNQQDLISNLSKIYKVKKEKIFIFHTFPNSNKRIRYDNINIKHYLDFKKSADFLIRDSSEMKSAFKLIFLFFGRKVLWVAESDSNDSKEKRTVKYGVIDFSNFGDWVLSVTNRIPACDRFFLRKFDESKLVTSLINSYIYPTPIGDTEKEENIDNVIISSLLTKLLTATVISIKPVVLELFKGGAKVKSFELDIGIGGIFPDRLNDKTLISTIFESFSFFIDHFQGKKPFSINLYKAGKECFLPLMALSMGKVVDSYIKWENSGAYHCVYYGKEGVKKDEEIGYLQITGVGSRYSKPLKAGSVNIEILKSEAFCETVFGKRIFCDLDIGELSKGVLIVDCGGIFSDRFSERFYEALENFEEAK